MITVSDDGKRFTDDKLRSFYDEFKEHQNHEVHDREQLIKCMTENKESVDALTKKTKDLLEAWEAANAVVRVSAGLGKVVKWIAGLGIPIYAVIEFLKHVDKVPK